MRKKLFYGCVVAITLAVTGCSGELLEEIGNQIIEETSGLTYNQAGLDYMDEGKYELALEQFELAKDAGMEKSAVYNNMSWASYNLGDYETALEYILVAQKVDKEDAIQWVNYGNALSGLGRDEEAIEKYKMAIKYDDKITFAYYGMGQAYSDLGNYIDAAKAFEEYVKLKPDDTDGHVDLTYVYLYSHEMMKAYDYITDIVDKHPDEYIYAETKGFVMEYIESKKNVSKYYYELIEKFPEKIDAYLSLGSYLYYESDYNAAMDTFKNAMKKFDSSTLLHSWVAWCYIEQGDLDNADLYADKAMDIDAEDSTSLRIKGNVLNNRTHYMEAVDYFIKANNNDSRVEESSYVDVIDAYLYAKRYQKAIDYGVLATKELPNSVELYKYLGYAYEMKNAYERAIINYKIALDIDAEDKLANYRMAYCYMQIGEYKLAHELTTKLLELDPEYSNAMFLKERLEMYKEDSENIVKMGFEDYYLYKYNSVDEYKDATDLFYKIKNRDDKYTFMLKDQMYDYIVNDDDDNVNFTLSEDKKKLVVRIEVFTETTDDAFIEYVDELENTEDMTLVIDLTDNSGGDTDSAANILDVLLPQVNTCMMIYSDGTTSNMMSDASQIKFNKIYVMINKDSASASELLTLSLKTYLDNVTVAGEKSRGKGVGQIVINDIKNETAYFIVNHYWNVRQKNINNKGVEPDIMVNSFMVKDYIKGL